MCKRVAVNIESGKAIAAMPCSTTSAAEDKNMSEQTRARDMLNDLLECDEGLSASDIDFIESMNEKRQFEWSAPQVKWLDDIYERVCV